MRNLYRASVTWVVWKEIPTIVVLSAEDDFRIRAIREAVDFWNAEFAQLGSPFRFGAIVRTFRSISAGDFVALKTKTLSPSLVNSMREANGDVIVVLSDDAGFNPFAFPWPALRKSWSQSQAFENIRSGPASHAMLSPTSWVMRLD